MKVAVIGTGIAGIGAAHALSRRHEVEVFERDCRAGGHSNTVEVTRPDGRTLAIDTGFIVHNPANYPHLVRLFRELGVPTQESDMSFAVVCRRCGIEYSGRHLWEQPRVLRSPRMLRLLAQIARFMATARRRLDGRHRTRTVAQFVRAEGYGQDFRDHFLVPLTSAIWSTSPGQAAAFPVDYALRFFDTHNLIGFRRHTWRTVAGGSREYVARALAPLGDRVHLGHGVRRLERDGDRVVLETDAGTTHVADAAVVATHPDQALAMLADPTPAEREVLGAITYTPSEAVLHTDPALLPSVPAARAAWNYLLEDCRDPGTAPTLTYYSNRLQALDEPEHYCVTLNRGTAIDPARVITRIPYAHPLFSFAALRAQARLPEISGTGGVHYAGAYHGHGFHEDGLVAGLRAAAALGAPL
ncbi:MAG TPA: FAD-dependent oxidoreductase [Miltoncostaeaceae bacterium]|nr:FAD-dependent oxidoreductase [Miltoncostaeaceae bacterium]